MINEFFVLSISAKTKGIYRITLIQKENENPEFPRVISLTEKQIDIITLRSILNQSGYKAGEVNKFPLPNTIKIEETYSLIQ